MSALHMTSLHNLLIFTFFSAFASLAKAEFVHPGIHHTEEGIDFVKEKIAAGEEPFKKSWELLKNSRYASLRWKANPVPHVQRGPSNNPNIGSSDFTDDSRAAYTHALHWALSGEKIHAQKSAEIIDAWSSTLKKISNHDARLLVGMSGENYLIAAELLRHYKGGWDGWPKENQEQFETMLRNIWYPIIKDFYPSANGNWDAAMEQTIIAMGVFLDDKAIFNRAITYFRKGKGNGAIGMYFKENGQCQETGRDQGHTQMGLEFLANTAETAWIQGIDLYSALDNRLLKGFEYTAKYNLGNDVPYEPYKSFEGRYHYKRISDDSRGRLHNMYEKVLNHYTHRRGIKAPYTQQAAEKNRPETRRHCFIPWATLMFYQQPFPAAPQQ